MKNAYEVRGNETIIYLLRNDGSVVETLISTKDLDKAKSINGTWSARWDKNIGNFYVGTNFKKSDGKYTTVKLHRWLTDCPTGLQVDHINHDTLNNRRSNLRICTHSQNCQNRNGARADSKTGIRGVYWHKGTGRWTAQAVINNKKVSLGYFKDIQTAKAVVEDARAKYMPYSQDALVI